MCWCFNSMTVLSCNLALGDRSGMPIPGLASEFDVHWTILTDDRNDNPATIYASTLGGLPVLPAQYTGHPNNIFATLRTMRIFNPSHRRPELWTATGHYSSQPLTEQEYQWSQDPCAREALISWSASPYQRPVTISVDGVTIMNSAGDPPDPVPEDTDYFWVATIGKNVPAVPTWFMPYAGAVNTGPFTIEGLTIPARCARLVAVNLTHKTRENTHVYRPLQLGIEMREARDPRTAGETVPAPFDLELPDQGLMYTVFNSSTGKYDKKRAMTTDSPKRPTSGPVFLNGIGGLLENPTLATIHLRTWKTKREKDFAVISALLGP